MTSCGSLKQSYVKPTERDPLFCPESAMQSCNEIVPNEKNPKAFAKGLLIDYLICKYKQAVLAKCITDYEAKP